ncbi:MAG: hypothetical protein ACREV9_05440 [Burkholderiales bacterium]
MANDLQVQIEDVLIRPMEEILAQVGQGIATAQRTMDLNSIATQTLLATDPALKEFGLEATWYHMPEVEVELKMALTMRREDRMKDNRVVLRKLRMYGAPLNASYQNSFNSDVTGASRIRAKIVSLPPARRPE